MFGKRLAEERRRLGRSQDDFAKLIDIGRSGYAAIEGDRAPLDVSRLVTLGEIAGVDVMYVMTAERAAEAAARLMDWDLVEAIFTGVQRWAEAHAIKVPPEKQMLLVKLLYQKFASKGCMDTQALNDTLRLVA